jgi:hypothetical protein
MPSFAMGESVRNLKLVEAGLFLLIVAAPLAMTPFSSDPFFDGKLVLVLAGCLCLWASGLVWDRRIGPPALALLAITSAATLFGADPLQSLGGAARWNGRGSLLLAACMASAVTLGPSIPARLVRRAGTWLAWIGVVVSAVGVAHRVAPEGLEDLMGVGMIGSTMGNQIFAAALLGVAVAAVLGADSSVGQKVALLAILTFGAAAFGERTSLALPAVAAIATVAKARGTIVKGTALAITAILMLVGWQLLQPMLWDVDTGIKQLRQAETDQQRLLVWRVMTRGVEERPVLGWGPGMARSAYLHGGTPQEIAVATRDWDDAHNLLLETAVAGGLLGLAALVWLGAQVVPRALRCDRSRSWVFGALVALGAFALVEPTNVVLTPMLFLFAGIACGPRRSDSTIPSGARIRTPAVVLLAGGLAISLLMMTAATLEAWAIRYGEPWAWRAAVAAQPWRVTAAEGLAVRLALDGRAGEMSAAGEARELIAGAISSHPWDVKLRLTASDVETLLHDPMAADRWVREHVDRFPADAAALEAEPVPPDLGA